MKTTTLLGPLPFLLGACAATSLDVAPAPLGTARDTAALLAVIDVPGPVVVETVASADWVVPLEGLVNLEHPRAAAAGLVDREEPIQVFFHVLRHPTHGDLLVDTGVERALRDAPERAAVAGLVASQMHLEKMKFRAPLGDWLAAHPDVHPAAVLLTHLHLDHVTGMRDAPSGLPVYVGPGEASARGFLNLFVQGPTDRALEGKRLVEWQFAANASAEPSAARTSTAAAPAGLDLAGVIDVFGDGSVWALHVPGHTPGSTAYLVRTPSGPVLLTGDACHTRWGWDHDVEPGTFSDDQARSAESLKQLRALAAAHPQLDVRLGHQ